MTLLISLTITVLGLLASYAAYKRRGTASAMRGTAWSLVPMAAYATGLTDFVSGLVFNPLKWLGVILAGVAGVLYVTSGVMLRRREEAGPAAPKAARGGRSKKAVESPAANLDPDLADIEAILRKRNIS
ncbi:MAG TPA: hypothetical protein VNW94_08185 [Streptosporangiaceae bacterium]|nr:hypothetical protein [Streptosporangiaceae bacterium]